MKTTPFPFETPPESARIEPFSNPSNPAGFWDKIYPHEPDRAQAAVKTIAALMKDLPVQDQMRAWLEMENETIGDSPEAQALIMGAAQRLLDWHAAQPFNLPTVRAARDAELSRIGARLKKLDRFQEDPRTLKLIDKAQIAGGQRGARLMGAAIRKHIAHTRVMAAEERVAEAHENVDRERLHLEARQELERIAANPVLQRLGEAGYHKLMEAARALGLGVVVGQRGVEARNLSEFPADLTADPQIFVVQHDWARAFEHASDFEGGDFHLPYPKSVFEFRISGTRVIAVFAPGRSDDDGDPQTCALFAELGAHWAVVAEWRHNPTGWAVDIVLSPPGNVLMEFCLKHIRAVSIALEAEVAETEVIRAPHRLNAKRERKGKIPLFDHHIINLAARKRYAPRLPEPGDLDREIVRRRLHFVRGHTRHYANHKVWIKWHMRGDPELGFIEKEYRL